MRGGGGFRDIGKLIDEINGCIVQKKKKMVREEIRYKRLPRTVFL